MSPPTVWGPHVWTLFHTMSHCISEQSFPHLYKSMFSIFSLICKNLPCPYCASDATLFLAKIKIENIKTKQEFINMMYVFHNYVNAKTKKPLFNFTNITQYGKLNLLNVIRSFIQTYNTKGNMNLINESFQRNLAISQFKRWIKQNIRHFAIIR